MYWWSELKERIEDYFNRTDLKVAVCLSGYPRTMKYTYPYFKRFILNKLRPDVFFFGYDDLKNDISANDILDMYQPVSHVIKTYGKEIRRQIWRDYGTRDVKDIRLSKGKPNEILSQYYNLWAVNDLKSKYEITHDFKYDIVIRMRTDYYFYRKISDVELTLAIEGQSAIIPENWGFDGVCDSFAFGPSEIMDQYSSFFFHIAKYNLEDGIPFQPEILLQQHIKKQQIKHALCDNPFWWELEDFKTNGCEGSYIRKLQTNPGRQTFT